MTATHLPRPLYRFVAAAVGAGLLGAWAVTGMVDRDLRAFSPGSTAQDASVRRAEALMPPAPYDKAAWLRAVDTAYAAADHGRGAEAWLRARMAHRRPGERLAVVMGVDDVIVQTHFAGLEALIPRSVRFVRTAHALGYAVFFVTGRTYGHGLGQVEQLLARRHVPASGFFAPPAGSSDEVSAKSRSRAVIRRSGYTLALSVAADGASFVGAPAAERAVRLPDFATRV
jgi:hypothetical protein